MQKNGIPLVSNQMPLSKSDDDVRVYHERVLDTIAISRRPRTLLLLRPSGPAADSFKTTMSLTMYYVYLSTEQEKGQAILTKPNLACNPLLVHYLIPPVLNTQPTQNTPPSSNIQSPTNTPPAYNSDIHQPTVARRSCSS